MKHCEDMFLTQPPLATAVVCITPPLRPNDEWLERSFHEIHDPAGLRIGTIISTAKAVTGEPDGWTAVANFLVEVEIYMPVSKATTDFWEAERRAAERTQESFEQGHDTKEDAVSKRA